MSRRVLRLLFAAALALAAGSGAAAPEVEPVGRTPLPMIERATPGTTCVADPAVMRRTHMTLLRHQRDETVHRGVREARDSLQGCIGCHASASTGSVAQAQTDFCVGCHRYAAVQIDCFECHASRPRAAVAARSVVQP